MEADHLNHPDNRSLHTFPQLAGQSVQRTPTVVGLGIDLVEIDRIAKALERTPGLVERLFTKDERRYCESARNKQVQAQRCAVRFAAKEAAMKAVGMGLKGRSWQDIEVVRGGAGEPNLRVRGRVAALAADRGGTNWLVSLTHTTTLAQATVLLLSETEP